MSISNVSMVDDYLTSIKDASFAVPDDMVSRARKILQNAGMELCSEFKCIVVKVRSRPPPVSHFHLDTKDVHIYLYPQSQVLPNVSDLRTAEAQEQLISASDPSLPRSRIGYGKGAFESESSCVRVPSISCFVEACLVNFVRQARKKDWTCSHDLHYMGWITYVTEYVYPRGYLDLDSLRPVFREFLLDAFIKNTSNITASFGAARDKLVASEI